MGRKSGRRKEVLDKPELDAVFRITQHTQDHNRRESLENILEQRASSRGSRWTHLIQETRCHGKDISLCVSLRRHPRHCFSFR